MPFILPSKRSSISKSMRFSKYRSVDNGTESPYFTLQKKKKPRPVGQPRKGRPTFRIITRGVYPAYEIAYGDDRESIEPQWQYVVKDLPQLIPDQLDEKNRIKWFISHFTTIYLEEYAKSQRGGLDLRGDVKQAPPTHHTASPAESDGSDGSVAHVRAPDSPPSFRSSPDSAARRVVGDGPPLQTHTPVRLDDLELPTPLRPRSIAPPSASPSRSNGAPYEQRSASPVMSDNWAQWVCAQCGGDNDAQNTKDGPSLAGGAVQYVGGGYWRVPLSGLLPWLLGSLVLAAILWAGNRCESWTGFSALYASLVVVLGIVTLNSQARVCVMLRRAEDRGDPWSRALHSLNGGSYSAMMKADPRYREQHSGPVAGYTANHRYAFSPVAGRLPSKSQGSIADDYSPPLSARVDDTGASAGDCEASPSPAIGGSHQLFRDRPGHASVPVTSDELHLSSSLHNAQDAGGLDETERSSSSRRRHHHHHHHRKHKHKSKHKKHKHHKHSRHGHTHTHADEGPQQPRGGRQDPSSTSVRPSSERSSVSSSSSKQHQVEERPIHTFLSPDSDKLRICQTLHALTEHSESKALNAYCPADGTQFKVREGPNYSKTKKKAPSKRALFDLVGCDVFTSEKKMRHIAQHLYLPAAPSVAATPFDYGDSKQVDSGADHNDDSKVCTLTHVRGVRRWLVVVFQIPDYAPSLWGSKYDGPGWNFVMYYKLSAYGERVIMQAESAVGKLVARFMGAEEEFAGDDKAYKKFRSRFKCIPTIKNHSEIKGLGMLTRKLMTSYNSKPFLTGPTCHTWYKTDTYMEVDIDVHQFVYPARRGVNSLKSVIPQTVIDVGLVVEGRGDEEQPEQILACGRVFRVDAGEAKDFGFWLKKQRESLEEA